MDTAILHFVIQRRHEGLTPFVVALTHAGRPAVVLVAAAVLSAFLAYRRQGFRIAAFPLIAQGLAWGTSSLLKVIVGRERPAEQYRLVAEHNYSFPSGHATCAFAFATILSVLAWRLGWCKAWLPLAWIAAILIATSRVYLGVHWATDILAGAIVGVGVVAGGANLGVTVPRRRAGAGRGL